MLFCSSGRELCVIAHWVIRLAKIAIKSLYMHDMRAMGRKLDVAHCTFLVDQYGGCGFPHSRDVMFSKAVVEDWGEEFAFFVEHAEVAVFDAVMARRRVGHGGLFSHRLRRPLAPSTPSV